MEKTLIAAFAKRSAKRSSLSQLLLLWGLTLLFIIIMLFPLFSLFSKAFLNKAGEFAGLENYIEYFSTPSLSVSVLNTIFVSLVSTIVSTVLGFGYAYALTRTNIKGKTFFRYIALIPIFMPTIVHGLGLVYLFGQQGIFTQMGIKIQLYGKIGIILSEIIYTFPQAFLMFFIALSYADGRLYEAADSMGCGHCQKFIHITIPEVKYTLISCFFVCFTLAFTDFGAPKVLGGSYNVLATDIYKQVAGQFNMNMGAVVGTLLLLPAIINFGADRLLNGKGSSEISAKAAKLNIRKNNMRDAFFSLVCIFVSLCLFLLVGVLVMGAFMKYYPYDMSLTLNNFKFNVSTGGFKSYLNSLYMSGLTAIFGTAFVFIYAYLIEKGRSMTVLKKIGKLLSVIPIALPGMVIGLSFIFFFNAKTNPLNFVYGTVIILVLSNIIHFYSVAFVTASGALKKLDKDFENVSQSMSIPQWKTFFKVSVPMCLPALLEIFMYYFVNSMVTVSAVVFLYSANFKVASIAITHMEESGDYAQAAAMSLLVLGVNLIARFVYELLVKYFKNKHDKRRETVV